MKERKIKRQNGYNSTWCDKHSIGLEAHMHIKHVENIDPVGNMHIHSGKLNGSTSFNL